MDTYSNSATRQALHGLAQLSGWLGGSVSALIDYLSKFSGRAAKAGLVAMPGASGLEIFRVMADGRIDTESPVGASAHAPLPTSIAGRSAVLRFSAERAVVKRFAVPASAVDVLPAIVENKIEGLGPWPVQGAIWGYRTVESAAADQLEIEVGIISRKLLDSTLLDAASAGLYINHAEIGDVDAQTAGIVIDFRRPERLRRWQRRFRGIATALAVASLTIAGVGLYYSIAAQRDLSLIEERATVLQQTLLGNTPATAAGAELSAANTLFVRKQNSPPVVMILNDLTRLVPDGTWLKSFEYSSALVTIVGHGFNVTKLVDDLEASPSFQAVNFAAATQRDPVTGSDIFAISAGVATRETAP